MGKIKEILLLTAVEFPIHFLIFFLCNEFGVFARQPVEILVYTVILLSLCFSVEYVWLREIGFVDRFMSIILGEEE